MITRNDLFGLVERRLASATLPPLNKLAASNEVELALANVRARRWPRQLPFPNIYVASTLERNSWAAGQHRLVLHDEGVIDICVAAAEEIQRYPYSSLSFVTFRYFVEQLICWGRRDLAMLLTITLFEDVASHPLLARSDSLLANFARARFSAIVRPRASARFASSCPFDVVSALTFEKQMTEFARSIFLSHELAHYIWQFPDVARAFVAPLGLTHDLISRERVVAEISEEVFADVLGIALTCCAFTRSIYSGSRQFMSAATAAILLIVHNAFCRIGLGIEEIANSGQFCADRRNALACRARLIGQAIKDRAILEQIFRWCRTRALCDAAIFEAAVIYAETLARSIEETFSAMARHLEAKRKSQPAELLRQMKSLNCSDDKSLRDYAVMRYCLKTMGHNVVRTLSVHSAQVSNARPASRAAGRIEPNYLNAFWDGIVRNQSPWQSSFGIERIDRPAGIFLDLTNWKLVRTNAATKALKRNVY